MTNLDWEQKHQGLVIGVDEVGRGPLAGPVVACACLLPNKTLPSSILHTITDSKKLTDKKRRALYPLLQQNTIYAFGVIDVEEIDKLNILNATLKAMSIATHKVIEQSPTPPTHVLIDGNRSPQDMPLPSTTIVKGDNISVSIACASILAKVYRDTLMQSLAQQYPHYGWYTNAGYGTKPHIDAINTHGITPHHRKTFDPIRTILATDSLF